MRAYGRPPEHSRFQPGQSGNPKGRPKGAATTAKAALDRKVPVRQNGRVRIMTVREIAHHKLADKAIAGDQKALAFLLLQAGEFEPLEAEAADATVTSAQDEAIIANYLTRRRHDEGGEP